MIALMVLGCAVYLTATEYISAKKSTGEVLLFRRGRVPEFRSKLDQESAESNRITTETLAREKTIPDAPPSIQKQTAVFHWTEVNYDIKIKSEPRRLLDDVDGWVRPGQLTALMVGDAYWDMGTKLTCIRVSLVLVKRRSSTCSPAVLQWAS